MISEGLEPKKRERRVSISLDRQLEPIESMASFRDRSKAKKAIKPKKLVNKKMLYNSFSRNTTANGTFVKKSKAI